MKRAVILTALSLEYSAARKHLTTIEEEIYKGTVYEKGTFVSGPGRADWEVILVEIGMGNSAAAAEGERALNHYEPDLLLFIGVAGGLKDVKPGDVVAGRKVYYYEGGRAEAEGTKARPEIKEATYAAGQRARVVARANEWQNRIQGPSTAIAPTALFGIIAAGEKVVGSTQSATWKLIQEHFGDANAIDMEGYGALLAAHLRTDTEAIVIRGISDTLDDKARLDGLNFQDIAARHASAFAFEMLAKLAEVDASPNSTPAPVVSKTSAAASAFSTPPITSSPSERKPGAPVKIYYSYATNNKGDKELIDGLKGHLGFLRRNNSIEEWDELQMLGGSNRAEERNKHLASAEIIILGMSTNYINSESYDYIVQSGVIKERQQGSAIIIPVLLRKTSDLEELTFGLAIFPRNHKPIVDNRENALFEVASEIIPIVKQLLKGK